MWKTMVIPVYQNNWSFSSKCVAIELWFTMVLWKKNYGMLLWNKYGTTPKTMKFWFTMEKTMVL